MLKECRNYRLGLYVYILIILIYEHLRNVFHRIDQFLGKGVLMAENQIKACNNAD